MMIHFIRPFWLLMLLPALLYLLWVMLSYRQRNPWKKVCDPHLLPTLIQTSSSSNLFLNVNLCLLYLISIFALAGPAWEKTHLPIYRDISSVMLVLDLSSNMQETDVNPDRLTRAKFKIRDLISTAHNTQMGLVAFTQEAFVASPLSQDANTLNALVDELHPQMMPLSGSEIGQGLSQGLKLLKQAGADRSTLLLITASEPTASSWAAAKQIVQAGHRLNVLAMLPNNATAKATMNKLQALANTGGGSFYLFTPDAEDIQRLLRGQVSTQSIKDEQADNAYFWQDTGPWFCLLLIPFALIVLREKLRHEK